MPIDKRELSRLSPEERIKKLRQLEEERKKESTEIEQLIKESMKELKTDKLAGEIAPEQRAVDISRLFEKSNGEKLEKTARQESKGSAAGRGYQVITQVYQDYSQLKEFYGVLAQGSSLTKEQLNAIGQIGERINIAEKYLSEGEKAASKLDASRAVLYKLKKETGID